MSFDDFLNLHFAKSPNCSAFQIPPNLVDEIVEKRVSNTEIEGLEAEYQVSLPDNYREFCKVFGGGDFGFTTIFCLDSSSDWFIFRNATEILSYFKLPIGLLPFSSGGTGGYYCFRQVGKNIYDEILYLDEMGIIEDTTYTDFLDFVVKNAYQYC